MERSAAFVMRISALLIVVAATSVSANTVDWMGVTWTLRGETSAVINGDGSLTITTLGGSSGDPWVDNWVLTAKLPTTTQWMEFNYLDQGTPNGNSPRAYVSSSDGGGETLIQCGSFPGYSTAYLNRHWYYNDGVASTDDWRVNEWINLGTRTAGEHAFKACHYVDGKIGLWYDGLEVDRVLGDAGNVLAPGDIFASYFDRAYLGMDGPAGQTFSVTYTSFAYGDQKCADVPEMGSLMLAAIGGLPVLGHVLRRRRA